VGGGLRALSVLLHRLRVQAGQRRRWASYSAVFYRSPGKCGRVGATRKQSSQYGYSRLIAHNRTHLTQQYWLNDCGLLNHGKAMSDEFTLVQRNHGPFPDKPTAAVGAD